MNVMFRGRTGWLLLFVGMITLAVAGWLSMNSIGYCFARKRFLSDEEKIEIAVRHVIAVTAPGGRSFMRIDGVIQEVEDSRKHNYSYRDADEFIRRNPDCCRVAEVHEQTGHRPGLAVRWTGGFSGYVRVAFKDGQRREDGTIAVVDRTSYLALTNCGRVWDGI